ncbi:uncharacterized protein LOC130751375 isoform X3 [Actinidia eriantha]|uniref:uncharacterized protein LOC130751375 isoform X3 n=1 Tax=Actinidia eriantha TaxID=165200 RepID=UPI002587C554|nr:uncharacterized protein LOC130751375 isoform X3 [Actinidia eriantha]
MLVLMFPKGISKNRMRNFKVGFWGHYPRKSQYKFWCIMVVLQLHLHQQPPISGGVYQNPHAIPPIVRSRNLSFKAQALPSRTQRIMESMSVGGEVGGAGGSYSYEALKRLDQFWSSLCSAQTVVQEPQKVVSSLPGLFSQSDLAGKAVETFDVLVCGGTLGMFIATALSCKGLRVGVVERGILKGREQEWNISRKELLELVEVGIMTENDIEQATSAIFNPNRCGFEGKGEIWVEDILNLGVSIEFMSSRSVSTPLYIYMHIYPRHLMLVEPAKLVEVMKKRFDSLGGIIFEGYSVSGICVYEDAAIRSGRKPDGVCLVVGSCCRGFKDNSTSDVIFSSSAVKKVGDSVSQYFWEAFPAGSAPMDRTTYMFTYVDPQPGCPKLEELLEDYWDLMPKYQRVSLDSLEILRVIFGIFPTFRDSPLPAAFDRVLQFGDASGIQSPVSFGGFGSLTRHLGRLSTGIYEAITDDLLDSHNLSLLNPYMPNLSASWLFQRAMSAKKQPNVSPDFINELLYVNFQSMQRLGDPVLRPFLQDVIQFGPLVKTLGLVMITKPLIIPSIFKQVGVPVLLDWSGHFFMLGYYTFLSTFLDPVIRPLVNAFPAEMKYKWKRQLDAWQYGAGLDYKMSHPNTTKAERGMETSEETWAESKNLS